MKRRIAIWAPLAIFIVFLAFAASELMQPSERKVVSRLVGKPLPAFALPPAAPGLSAVKSTDKGPRLINIFASWCVPCIAEAPHLMALKRAGVPIDAVALRDKPEDVVRFLKDNGNPYRGVGADPASAVQFALGSSGVPETFVVDAKGIIRMQHIGDIRADNVSEILNAWKAAQ